MPSDIAPYSTIYINSQDAIVPYNTANGFFSVNLSGFPFEPIPGKTVKLGLLQATMEVAYTNVNASNNAIRFAETTIASGANAFATVLITPGTYTLTTLATAVTTALNAGSPGGVTYTVTGNTTTGLLTFASNSATIETSLLFASAQSTSADLLGFPEEGAGPFVTGTPLVAPQAANLVDYLGPQSLIVRCGQITSRVYDSRTGSVGDILAVIPNTITSPGQVLTYVPAVPRIFGTASQVLTQLSFNITDTRGATVLGLTPPIEFLIGVYHFDDY